MGASIVITAMVATTALGGSLPAEETTEPPLIGTPWVLDHLVSGSTVTPVTAANPGYLLFQPSGGVEGFDTCNWLGASAAAVDADSLAFTDFWMTKRGCRDTVFAVEFAVQNALNSDVDYRIEAGSLWIIPPTGRWLVYRAEAALPE